MKSCASVRLWKRISLVMALALALICALQPALAESEAYYSTWAEYQASGQPSSTWNNVADAMDVVFARGVELFEAGDYKGAYNCVNDGYYGYYETTGFERIAMGYISGSRKTEVELQFSAAKAVAKKEGDLESFKTEIEALKAMIHADANVLDGVSSDSTESDNTTTTSTNTSSAKATAAFAACFSIIVREGFEAILIVGAIIAYLRKAAGEDVARRRKTLTPVYIGSLLGVVMSFALAWLLNAIKLANTASQEIIEGVTALLAVCVLYYVSNWMLSKSETDAWTGYIKTKTQRANGGGLALAFTAFLAVFREGAEVVLFYQPMLNGDYSRGSVWSGFIVGCVVLVFVYLAIHFLSVKIPLKPFFTATSVLMFLMSISFLGAGIKELIEGDVIAYVSPEWLQWIPTNDVLDVLGIYPTLQTLLPQLLLLIVTVVIFVIQTKKNNKIHAEAEARRAEEAAKAAEEKRKAEDAALRATIREVVEEVLAQKKLTK